MNPATQASQTNNPESDLAYWLALWHSPGVGPKTFQQCLTHYPSLKTIFTLDAPTRKLLGIKKPLLSPQSELVEKALAWCQVPDQHIIRLTDMEYPFLLREIAARPPILYVKGNVKCLMAQQIAMVGTRRPTPQGREHARFFANALTEVGLVLTSGLALGIDSIGHHTVAEKGRKTIAVLGTGVDVIYPRVHCKLAGNILAQAGALVSEFPLGATPQAQHFPRRNRIISGLSMGVLVVEAALKSGSLITARYALEQGREVYAVPGSIHNPVARGCHSLIRQGAKLVEQIDDILGELTAMLSVTSPPRIPMIEHTNLDSEQPHLVECIGDEPTSIDVLQLRTGLSAHALGALLTQWELSGHIKAVPGGYMRA